MQLVATKLCVAIDCQGTAPLWMGKGGGGGGLTLTWPRTWLAIAIEKNWKPSAPAHMSNLGLRGWPGNQMTHKQPFGSHKRPFGPFADLDSVDYHSTVAIRALAEAENRA